MDTSANTSMYCHACGSTRCAVMVMHACRKAERNMSVQLMHKNPGPICDVFWCSFGDEKWEGAAACTEKAVQADPIKYCFYQDEKPFLIPATFPLEGWKSKVCAMCNDLHTETSFIACAPAVMQTNYFLIKTKGLFEIFPYFIS